MNRLKPNTLLLPAVIAGFIAIGGGMFVAGRHFAPAPPPAEAHVEAGPEEHHDDETIQFTPEAMKSAGIVIQPVRLAPEMTELPFSGQIEASPDRVARVSSIVPGRITRINVAIGQKVRRGDVLAILESRDVGEAQSAFTQAAARLRNARSAYQVTLAQAKAGVFSRAPLEAARGDQLAAAAEVRAQENAVRQAKTVLENTVKLAAAGGYAHPALEAARGQNAAAVQALTTAKAALDSAEAATESAQAELDRRRQIAAAGGYGSRAVEDAQRSLTAAQSARATAQSEVTTTRANLARMKALSAEGLVSRRDAEAAQTALDTANARLETAQADEKAALHELERQQKLAATDVAGIAEVRAAQSSLITAQTEARTRRAEVQRAESSAKLAATALRRESAIFEANVANRREVSQTRSTLESANNSLQKARGVLTLADTTLRRETGVFQKDLNNTAQTQAAKAALVSAESDFNTTRATLKLFQSSPGPSASVPIRAPIAGIVESRDFTLGEWIEAGKMLVNLADLSTVHVDMFLPERSIAQVQLDAPVSITVDAVPGHVFRGRIELIHAELDPKTRTVEAHAEIPNPGFLKPGMFARGRIATGIGRPSIRIPSAAVQDVEGKKTVFVATENAGGFETREVEIGPASGGLTRITSGLQPGDRIVVKGAFMVKAQAMKAELGHEH